MQATGYGGAAFFRDFAGLAKDCYFLDNNARSGGALQLTLGDMTISGGLISGNKSIGGDVYDMGGGVLFANTEALIENCIIKDNVAQGPTGTGGAIKFFGGYLSHIVRNCLIIGNFANTNGGAISCELFATPEIQNCTFSENSTGSFGGAIFCDRNSDPTIIDSIFSNCNKHAILEENVGNAIVSTSLFYNNPDGDYGIYDSNTGQITTTAAVDYDATNIEDDPLFVTGPFGSYYLDQISSPAVNNGSASAAALGMNIYTTDISEVADDLMVDIGYHYGIDQLHAPKYTLTIVRANDYGTVEAKKEPFKFPTLFDKQ